MVKGSIHGRLERLEERTLPATIAAGPSDARRKMLRHLDQVVRFRRGELDPEGAAEVEELNAAARSRFEEFRAGGVGG